MTASALGPTLHTFLVDHLGVEKGLRRSSVQSYRDTIRLLILFIAAEKRSTVTRLDITDFTFERILAFLRHLEDSRGNCPQTRNQRLAALRTFFDFLATRMPEMVTVCQQVAAIPTKRSVTRQIRFLETEDIARLFAHLPKTGRLALRDRALLLFLYNTGARAQEVADLRRGDVDLGPPARVRLHGKGDKWRRCPLWPETATLLQTLFGSRSEDQDSAPVFVGPRGQSLTRFGIYKLVRRHAAWLDRAAVGRVTPHVFRHTTAVHLLESGVEMNVVRGWLGHVNIETTDRYTEISMRSKEAALAACEPPVDSLPGPRPRAAWKTDEAFLAWLAAL